MCGIFAVVDGWPGMAEKAALALSHRGPDATGSVKVGDVELVHTRLSIVDTGAQSNQPFWYGRTAITFNGEIWNYREVRKTLAATGRKFKTNGDTEVLAAALDAWGEAALPRLQGMFAVAWVSGDGALRVARDRFGEVPLHASFGSPFMVASELKTLAAVGADAGMTRWVEPGSVITVKDGKVSRSRWYEVQAKDSGTPFDEAVTLLAGAVEAGVVEREMADVPVCCLLSGGIDSAVILRVLAEKMPGIVAYTAVMDPKSPDLACARLVASELRVELREVPVQVPTASGLKRVVGAIEMPHKAQVEIGWACLALADRMKADGFKVTFSGEGSDELWASYGFSYHGVQADGWFGHRKKLFTGQHRKNFARCNKIFMAASVECRLPFLSTGLVELALSLPESSVKKGSRSKAVLQDAFKGRIPDRVMNRPKLAFQDGLGLKETIASLVKDPKKVYQRMFEDAFQEVKP
jgi:asparagine synthase (glutamine-hydrolysing)